MNESNEIPPPSIWRDRALWGILLVSALVLIGRGMLISHAHSEYWDDQYHIIRGERFWWLDKRGIPMNDPPLGEALVALPVSFTRVLMGTWDDAFRQVRSDSGLREHPLSPDALLMLIAVWKSLLFLPCVMVVHAWARQLYGYWGGALAVTMLLLDPTFAAHTPIAALDTLGATAVALACWLAWRYALQPASRRLIGLSASVAAAMLIKHTALILPLVVVVIIAACWRASAGSSDRSTHVHSLRHHFQPLATGVLLVVFFIWVLTLFDWSEPRHFGRVFNAEYTDDFSFKGDLLNGSMMRRWPAGIYLGSIAEAMTHGSEGHGAMLFGVIRQHGWWYYFPIIATFKIPLGFAIILLTAVVSLLYTKWNRDEWSIVIPFIAWTAFLMSSPINIGFRHYLPAYVFLLIFAGRTVTGGQRWMGAVCIFGLIATAVHSLTFHPNYLSYVNFPREKVYLQISDSNIEWGQALKQVRQWLDENPQKGDVWIGYYGERTGTALRYYLGDRVKLFESSEIRKMRGTLVLSPAWLNGIGVGNHFTYLRDCEPVAVIGDSMLVYKLE